MREPHCTKVTSDAHYCIRSGSDYSISEKRSSRLDEAGDAYRVNPIVGSFKPERSQSPEKRVKSTLVLAALQQALRTEATISRRKSTSSQLAPSTDLAILFETDASDDARDVEDADGVNRRHALLAGAPPLGKHDARKAMAATQCLDGRGRRELGRPEAPVRTSAFAPGGRRLTARALTSVNSVTGDPNVGFSVIRRS